MKAFVFELTEVETDEYDIVQGGGEIGDRSIVVVDDEDNEEEARKILITRIWGDKKPEGHKYECTGEYPLAKGAIL
jgi:hypothetical protein